MSKITDILKKNQPLSNLTTLNFGGNAKFFVEVASKEDFLEAIKWSRQHGIEFFILGGGSGVLISDDGFDGMVIKMNMKGLYEEPDLVDENFVLITCAAGEVWDDLVKYAVGKNLAGIECLSGIPGLVGSSPIQNIGAYGQEVADTIVKLLIYDVKNGEVKEFSNADCEFTYRDSKFKGNRDFVILDITFRLKKDGSPTLTFDRLAKHFEGKNPSLQEVRNMVIEFRKAVGMYIDLTEKNRSVDTISSGSFFVNPVISLYDFQKIQQNHPKLEIPNWPVGDDKVKVPAGWLIDNSGFSKGDSYKNVGISSKHTLALINKNNGTAAELIEFAKIIKRKVYEKFDISIIPEPTLLGFEKTEIAELY